MHSIVIFCVRFKAIWAHSRSVQKPVLRHSGRSHSARSRPPIRGMRRPGSATGPTRLGPKKQRSFDLRLVSSFDPEGRVVPCFLLPVEPQRLSDAVCSFHRTGVGCPGQCLLGRGTLYHGRRKSAVLSLCQGRCLPLVLSQRCTGCAPFLTESHVPPILSQGSTHNNCASTFGLRAGLTAAGTLVGCLSSSVPAMHLKSLRDSRRSAGVPGPDSGSRKTR